MINPETSFNDNITLLRIVSPAEAVDLNLQPDEWYALMVVDHGRKEDHTGARPDSFYFDPDTDAIGLEHSSKRIYLSKKYNRRHQPDRGDTWLVRVKDPFLCIDLTY